ncbi:MAG: cytochrome c [Gemmatimonadaceae bacterium]|nr:cytochrome c [Gemmatimonadaceae bacterium]
MHTPLRLSLALCSAAVMLAACGGSSAKSGSQSPSPAGGGAANKVPAKPAAVTPANIAMGDSIFNNGSCQRCHGKGGIGAPNGPTLDGKKWLQLTTGSFDEIVGIITTGVPAEKIKDPTHKNPMRARGGPMNLTDPQVQALAAYVYTLTHK